MSGAGRRAAIKARLDVNGRLDQLEDRLSGTQEAGGSNPPVSTLTYCSFMANIQFVREQILELV